MDTINWTQKLQEYIRIDTSQGNYKKAIEYLIDLTNRLGCGLNYRIHTHNTVPLLIITKPGNTDRSILLNSHMDVANVGNEDDWLYGPFSGYYNPETDRLYGRGVQDMKSQAIQYMAVLYNLSNTKLDYTVHMSFVPNEGIGSVSGLADFVRTPQFRALNIEFVLDENYASPFHKFLIFYTERTIWQFAVKTKCDTGHAAMPLVNTCEAKLKRLLNEIDQFRQRDLETNIAKRRIPKIGYYTTINMTRTRR